MGRVLIIKNIKAEGPGTIEDFLKGKKMPYKVIDLSAGERLPEINEFTHIVVMGGPMAVYEMEKYDFLEIEADYLKGAIDKGKNILGVCLGAQLLAHVLGARVSAGGVNEVGWYIVDLTDEGVSDPVMGSLAINGTDKAEVFQWHGDTFDIPDGAVRLAFNKTYPNQAFRYGYGIYALQFHIEVTPEIIGGWFKEEKAFDTEGMVSHSKKIHPQYLKRALGFYKSFFSL